MAQGRGNAIVFTVTMLAVLQLAAATDHTVGDSSGWFIPPNAGFYDDWAAKQTFQPGDNLVFNYNSELHDLQISTAQEYNGCTANQATTRSTGSDTIPLPKAGDYFFICNVAGHCAAGMKLKVTVGGATAPPPATPPAVAPVTPPATPPVVAPPPKATPPPATPPPATPPPATPPAVAPVVPPTAPPANAPAPVVKAPAPAPVVKAPVPSPVKAPVKAPVPSPVEAPVPVAAPTPVIVAPPNTFAPAPTPAASSAMSLRVCYSFVAAAAVGVFGALFF